MRILVNYSKEEQGFIGILTWHLRQRNIEAIATTSILSIGDLQSKAASCKAEAILCCNQGTLANLVPGAKPTLDDYRGSVLRYDIPIVICNSLTHTQTVDHGSWLLGIDIGKLLTSKQAPTLFTYTVLEEPSEQFQLGYDWLRDCVLIAYDIETITVGGTPDKDIESGVFPIEENMPEGGDTLISCVTWCGLHKNGEIRSYVLPLIDFGVDHWTSDLDYMNAILLMRNVNALNIPKVMHNGMYDSTHSICYHAEPKHWTLDTMALAHSEYSSLPKSLDFVASINLPDYIQWKNESSESSKNKDIQSYWGYNAKDGFYTLRICMEQLRKLPAYARINYSKQFPMVYPSLYCNFEGFKVDIDVRNSLRKKAKAVQVEALVRIQTMVDDDQFNPGSPKQVAHIVYDIFGATDPKIGWKKDPKTKKKTKMTRGTNEKNLKSCGEQHPLLLRLTDAIVTYREQQKAIGTYFDFRLKNGRLLWSLNPFGTDTNRMACSASSFWVGTQVQNIPPYAKGMLVAEDGWELMEADQSQSDARGTAYLAQDLTLIAALEQKEKDFYKSCGTLFFGIPYENVTKDFRNAFLKKIIHGTNYMMGAATFVENAGVQNLLLGAAALDIKITMKAKPSEGEVTVKGFAAMCLESYHRPFSRVRPWYAEVKAEVKQTKLLKSPSGHTRFFFGDIEKKYQIFSSAVAHGPQHLTGAVLNKGFWKIWKMQKARPKDMRMKAQIHDSALMQYNDQWFNIDFVQEILTRMNNPIEIHKRMLSIPVDYKLGKDWGNMKEYK
jgi:DNA polymerase I-like protein with 3'-5' exonuclease and polymerase domains